MPKQKYIVFVRDFQTSVFPQYIIVHLWNKLAKNIFGTTVRLGMVNRAKVQEYIIPPLDWKKLQNLVYKKVEQDKNFLQQVGFRANKAADKLNAFTEKNIYQRDLTKLSNRALVKIYQDFFELNLPVYGYGNFIFIVEFGERAYFSSRLKKILAQHAPREAQALYSLLTTSTKKHIFQEQSLAMLKLSAKIESQPRLKSLILHRSIEEVVNFLTQKFPIIYREFQQQWKKYHWLFYNFEGPALIVKDFILFAKDILKRGAVRKQLKHKLQEIKSLKKRQNAVLQKLHFTERERWMVQMAQFTAWFQPYRKARQFKSCWHMEKYFKEVARRLFISLDQVRYLTHWEMAKALRTGKVDAILLNERKKIFVYLFLKGKASCLSGEEAEEWFLKNVKQEKVKRQNEFQGTTACGGQAKGPIRIVNSFEEGAKFKEGEILISYSTNPTLLSAMRVAGAIVTEEGGLTCHAAIVSRELNKPCVIGVKGIVKNLKNGELVRVDAKK